MENAILKKRLNTYKSSKGTLKDVSNEVILEVLRAWENWPGTAADLYRELGISKMQMVTMIQNAKRLIKSGAVVESEFREIAVAGGAAPNGPCQGIELGLNDGKVLRFPSVDPLIEFLKKAAA
jgi:hypothetical protein